MLDLVSLIAILLGALLVLVGLVLIANQVRVHQIQVYGVGSWLFRGGVILSVLGLLLLLANVGPREMALVGTTIGGAGLLGALFTLNHERTQALHGGAESWDWLRSLTVQMVVLSILVLLLALIV